MGYAQIGNPLNQLGATGAANVLVPSPQQQLHPSIEDLTRGLSQVSTGLQAILNRINGPRPTDTVIGQGKAEAGREPSTFEYLQLANRQMSEINIQVQQIADSIG